MFAMIETLVTLPFFIVFTTSLKYTRSWNDQIIPKQDTAIDQMRIENQQNNSCLKKTRCVLTPQMPPQGAKIQMPNLV